MTAPSPIARIVAAALVVACGCLPPLAASARGVDRASEAPSRPRGRPKVVLDELVFPSDLAAADLYRRHLRETLAHEARRADWGAGRKSRIEYRFYVTELSVQDRDDAVFVRCSAFGKLPRGKSAKSQLAFSGERSKRTELVRRVLDIVARGVITRLAELERVRRGDLRQTGVRRPIADIEE